MSLCRVSWRPNYRSVSSDAAVGVGSARAGLAGVGVDRALPRQPDVVRGETVRDRDGPKMMSRVSIIIRTDKLEHF